MSTTKEESVATVRPGKFRSPFGRACDELRSPDGGCSKASSEEREMSPASSSSGDARKQQMDGNWTDDSGVDSISCLQRRVQDSATKKQSSTFPTSSEDYELRLVKKASRVRERIRLLEDKYGGGGEGGQQEGKDGQRQQHESTQIVLDPIDPSRQSSLAELGRIISHTGDLLSRNSGLRASITVTKSGGDKATTIVIPATPKQARKRLSLKRGEGIRLQEAPTSARDSPAISRKREKVTSSSFARQAQARKPVLPTGLGQTALRRKPSVRRQGSTRGQQELQVCE